MNLKNQIKKLYEDHISKRLDFLRRIDPLEPQPSNNYTWYNGVISMMHPQYGLKKGEKVLTPRGVGEVFRTFPWRGIALQKNGLFVEVWLKRKYYKSFKYEEVYQYIIWNEQLGKYIPLSNSCYGYMLDPNEQVRYRVTTRGYAMLSDEEKEMRKAIYIFNDHRGGRSILRHLLKEGFEIKKP